MPEDTEMPEKYQQAEWIVNFVTEAGNNGRSDELAETFELSNVGTPAEIFNSLRTLLPSVLFPQINHRMTSSISTMRRDYSMSMLTVEGLEAENPRKGLATTVPMIYALGQMFRFRTLRNFTDGMFLSARIVDKFIAG